MPTAEDVTNGAATEENVPKEEKAFYDVLIELRDQHDFAYSEDKCRSLAKKIKEIIDANADWMDNRIAREQLKFDVKVCLVKNGYPPQHTPEVFRKIMEQAENYKKNANPEDLQSEAEDDIMESEKLEETASVNEKPVEKGKEKNDEHTDSQGDVGERQTVEEVPDGKRNEEPASDGPRNGGLLDEVAAEDLQEDSERGDEPEGILRQERGKVRKPSDRSNAAGVSRRSGVGDREGGNVSPAGEVTEFDADSNPIYVATREEANVEPADFFDLKKRRATSDKKYGLTKEESTYLSGYIQFTFKIINEKLNNETLTAKDMLAVEQIISALKKFPTFEGRTYRNLKFYTENAYNDFVSEFVDGKTVLLKAFSSSSKKPNGLPLIGNRVIHMIIDGVSGVDIADTYGLPRQQEVIYLPGTKVNVKSISTANDGNLLIHVEEVTNNDLGTNNDNTESERSASENRGESSNGEFINTGISGTSGSLRESTWNNDRRDGVLSERGESDSTVNPDENTVDEFGGSEDGGADLGTGAGVQASFNVPADDPSVRWTTERNPVGKAKNKKDTLRVPNAIEIDLFSCYSDLLVVLLSPKAEPCAPLFCAKIIICFHIFPVAFEYKFSID